MPLIFGSYEVSDDDGLKAALAFDEACLANYDFGGTSPPDSVDTADIGRLVGSQMVGINAREAAELIRLGSSAPWHRVPLDASIEDAAPGSALFDAAMDLRAHFESIVGVKAAKCTKLLAMKRPSLYPVIDDRVVRLYKVAAARHSEVSHPTTIAIREDVMAEVTGQALSDLRLALLAVGSDKAFRLAQLTRLRLRDVVLWQHWELVGEPPVAPARPLRVAW